MSAIQDRASFDFIRYSNCWEDAEILLQGLEPKRGDRILSIASGGDNSFSLLTSEPEMVVAVDLSPAQTALVELKSRAFAELAYEEMLAFLGFSESMPDQRAATYRGIRSGLSSEARGYWDGHDELIRKGVIHTGKFERYFGIFRTRVLPLVHRRSRVLDLMREKSLAEQERFYDQVWDTWRWKLMFRLFFSRVVMGRLGRDPELFRYVQGSVGDRIMERTRHALTAIPTSSNPYVRYILTGSFGNALPHFARREHFESIRSNLGALRIVLGSTEDGLRQFPGPYDGMNLSDIFEYMTPELTQETAISLAGACSDGARFVYWNMLAPRDLAALLPDRFRSLGPRAGALFRRDQAFFYQRLHIDEVI